MMTISPHLRATVAGGVRSGLRRLGVDVGRVRPAPYRPRSLPVEPRTILDVGAADGTPELYDAYPGAAIVAFEPIAEQIEALRPKLAHRDVEYVNVAVGSADGTARLHVDPENLLKSSLNDRTALTSTAVELRDRTVAVRTLDDVVAEHGWSGPFALKVDTEGFELDVLRGAAATLRETAVVHCETSVGARFEGGYLFRDLAELLIDAGFDLVDLTAAPRGADGRTIYADCVWVPVGRD